MRFPAEQALYAALYARRTWRRASRRCATSARRIYVDVGLRNAINAGVTLGPRMLTAVHAIGSTGGHCRLALSARARQAARADRRRLQRAGTVPRGRAPADEVRRGRHQDLRSGGVLSEADPVDVPQLTPAELERHHERSAHWKRKVAAHAHGDLAARLAIEAGVDSIEHGSFLTEATLKLMKQKGVYLVPTRLAVYWVNKRRTPIPPQDRREGARRVRSHDEMFKAALKIGVPIAFGTDAGVSPHGMNAMEFGLMTERHVAGRRAARRHARSGEAAGRGRGSRHARAGKLADVVAVPATCSRTSTPPSTRFRHARAGGRAEVPAAAGRKASTHLLPAGRSSTLRAPPQTFPASGAPGSHLGV